MVEFDESRKIIPKYLSNAHASSYFLSLHILSQISVT